MVEQPLVSIIVNNYNYARFLDDAIDSALSQTYQHVEVIVVDDGSTDNSRDIIQLYQSRVIPVFKHNGGQASAMNAGFKASKGNIICFLDADDLCFPDRALKVVSSFQSFPEIDWFFHESIPLSSEQIANFSDKFSSGEISSRDNVKRVWEIDFREDLTRGKLPDFTPSTSNLCFSRRLLEKIFPLPEIAGFSGLAICDTYLKYLAVGQGKGCKTHEDLGIFRIHSANLFTNQEILRKRTVFSEIFIASGYCVRKQWPEFSKMGNKLFSKGFGTYLKIGNENPHCTQLVKEYFAGLSRFDKSKIYLTSLYYFFKLSLGKSIV